MWSGAGKKYISTNTHTTYQHNRSHTIATTHCSYYKTTTRLLHVVVITHTLRCNVAAKKIAFTAQKMRDKRVTLIILYYVGNKKAAVTPP
jgi:hypothetical protein